MKAIGLIREISIKMHHFVVLLRIYIYEGCKRIELEDGML